MSDFIEVTILGLVLSADSFSAALAMGLREHKSKDALIFAFSSGFAEFLAAAFGAFLGSHMFAALDAYDHWISFGILLLVSIHLILDGIAEIKNQSVERQESKKFHHIGKIFLISFATSLDALAVGVSLGMLKENLNLYLISIGSWAFVSTVLGLKLASFVPKKVGAYAHFLSALILTFIGVSFL